MLRVAGNGVDTGDIHACEGVDGAGFPGVYVADKGEDQFLVLDLVLDLDTLLVETGFGIRSLPMVLKGVVGGVDQLLVNGHGGS
jgi:hypothetical protein